MIDLLIAVAVAVVGAMIGIVVAIGAIDLVQRIQQRVRVYRVGRMLQDVEREAYHTHRGRGATLSRVSGARRGKGTRNP